MPYPVLISGGLVGMAQPTIYGLVDPREPENIRYVGATLYPAMRYIQHMTRESTVKGQWIAALAKAGLAPTMIVLEAGVSREALAGHEAHWIRVVRSWGQADLNWASKHTHRHAA